MSESRVYNAALLAGMLLLLSGVVFQSWMAIAIGAMIAGVGGVFAVLSAGKKK